MEDESSRCDFCGKTIDFRDVAAIDMQMVRGRVVDEDDDDDDDAWTYGLNREFCSEEHFREWAQRPLPPVKEWDDWAPAEGDLTGCAAIALVGAVLVAIVAGLAVYGAVQAVLAIT